MSITANAQAAIQALPYVHDTEVLELLDRIMGKLHSKSRMHGHLVDAYEAIEGDMQEREAQNAEPAYPAQRMELDSLARMENRIAA